MIGILVKNSSGAYWHVKHFFNLAYSYVLNAGCMSASFRIPATQERPALLDTVEVWDNLSRLWVGECEDLSEDSETGECLVGSLGFSSYLKGIDLSRLWVDTGYAHWDTTPPVAFADSREWEILTRDNNNRLYMRVPRGTTTKTAMISGLYYRLGNTDMISQAIYSLTFDWETGAGYDHTKSELRLWSFTSDADGITQEWARSVAGAGSGSATVTITASRKGLVFGMYGVAAQTPADETCWAKITNIRVNGLSSFTGSFQADEVIKDILTAACPLISADQSKIDTGAYTIPSLYVVDTNVFDAIQKASEGEDFHFGIYDVADSDDLPRMTYKAFARSTIDYSLDQTMGKLVLSGKSLDNVYNAVKVSYQTAGGRTTYVTRTTTVAALGSRTKTAHISVNTSSLALAQKAGDIFLAEQGRLKFKGTFSVMGIVYHNTRGLIPANRMRPGEVVHIRDLAPMTSPSSLNGENTFLITAVSVDDEAKRVDLELDTYSNRLDLFLARRRIK